MPRRAHEAGIGTCGHCGQFARCIKEASYDEPLCPACFDALEVEGMPYVAECVKCGGEDLFLRWPEDEERDDLRCADCDNE
jgi:hypothetical protein